MNKVGRNDPCPCGSGLKFKKCHGGSGGVAVEADPVEVSESARKNGWLNYPTRSYQRMLQTAPWPNELGFWALCARRFGQPILCLCCGTGREALHLGKEGFEVVGVDVNEGFVDAANDEKRHLEADRSPLNVQFHRADVITMDLGRKFPFAMMATQSFQLLLTDADQRQFLQTLHRHLSDGGVFAFNVTIAFLEGNKFVNGLGERIGVYSTDLDRLPRILTHGPLNQRVSTLDEIKELLRGEGFEMFCVRGATENLAADVFEADIAPRRDENEYTILARKV